MYIASDNEQTCIHGCCSAVHMNQSEKIVSVKIIKDIPVSTDETTSCGRKIPLDGLKHSVCNIPSIQEYLSF